MDFPITGASFDDPGPLGCVARFIRAGVTGDSESAAKELHPDALAGISGGVTAPPGMQAAAIGAPEEKEDGIHVPTQLTGPDGTEQRFVFVVRPCEDRCGIDLDLSMKATFGGDPFAAVTDALRAAVEPLGEAMAGMGDALGSAMGEAFGGGGSGSGGEGSSGPAARRIGPGDALPESAAEPPASIVAHVLDVEVRRRASRSAAGEDFSVSTELQVKCRLDLDPAWSAQCCRGVTLDAATSVEGEDLRPQDADESLGSESYASWEREQRDFYFKLPLAAPQQPFTGLAALGGTVRLDAVGGEQFELVLGPVSELLGRTLTVVPCGVDLTFERDGDGLLTVRGPSAWFDRMQQVVPTAPNGDSLGESWSQSGDVETTTRVYTSDVPDDASLVARFWSRSGLLSLPFTVEGLPVRMG